LILEALISFLPTPADGAIGALDWTSAERKRLAKKSVDYHCPTCGCKAVDLLPELKPKSENEESSKPKSKFQKEIEKLQQLQHAQHAEKKEENKDDQKDGEEDAGKDEKEPLLKEEEKEQPKSEEPKADEPAKAETEPAPVPVNETAETVPAAPAPVQPAAAEPQNTQQPAPTQNTAPPAEAPPQFVDFRQPEDVALQDDGMWSWMVDPVLHGIIVVLAVLCLLLFRKLQAMMDELEHLNDVLEV
jgi:chemotaxis protein histidine kinase CheA